MENRPWQHREQIMAMAIMRRDQDLIDHDHMKNKIS